MINLDNLVYRHYNERDLEIPALLNLVKDKQPRSFLDVGAHYSWHHYAQEVKALLPEGSRYSAVDILPCQKTAAIVDRYFEGDVCSIDLQPADFVACISTIEHCGLSTYKRLQPKLERDKVFLRLLRLTKSDLFLTFPVGLEHIFPNEYANIPEDQFLSWIRIAKDEGFSCRVDFYFNEFPQGKEKWHSIDLFNAFQKPMIKEKGTQCVCLLHLHIV